MSFRRSKIPKFIPIISLLILLVLGPIVFSFLQNARGVEAAWVDDNFSYRNAIPITSHTAAESNVYVTATIDTSASGQFQADCGDLRFTTVGGDILPYYIVSGCVSASTVVHVFFDTMPAGAQTIYYYYGNPSATNGYASADYTTQASNYVVGTVGSQEKGGAPIAYWKFDEGTGTTTTDSSSNKFSASITTATWQNDDLCKSGKCLYFNGTSSVATVADNTLLRMGTSNWTISVNIKMPTATAVHPIIVKRDSTGTSNPGYQIQVQSDGLLYVYFSDGSAVRLGGASSIRVDDNNWHNLIVVFTRTSSAVIYVDGKQVGSVTISTQQGNEAGTDTLDFGKESTSYFKGFIDDIKIYNYARTAAQIKSDFKSRGTAKGSSVSLSSRAGVEGSLSNGLVGYWKMDEASGDTTTDSSGNGLTGTVTTGTAVSAGKFGNTRDFVSASTQGVTINDNDILEIGTSSNYSGFAWIKPDSTTGRVQIFGKRHGGCSEGYNFDVLAGGTINLNMAENGANYIATSTTTVPTTDWTFVGFTVDRKTNKAIVYINGQQSGTQADITNMVDMSNTCPMYIALWGPLGNQYFDGKIDEVRIYNRALSPREVRDLYNWAPGPISYFPMEESSGTTTTDTSGGLVGTLTSGPTWTSGKYGKGIDFESTSDQYVTYTAGSTYNTAKANLTIGTWFKRETSVSGYLIANNGGYVSLSESGGNITGYVYPAGATTCTTSGITIINGNWHHLSLTWDGTTLKVYIDGKLGCTDTTTSGSITTMANEWRIGGRPSNVNEADGVLDDVKIYNYARTQKQIVEDMNADHPVGGSPVGSQIGYWRFDEGYGTTANNSGSGGTSLNGVVNNATWTNNGKFGKALSFDGTGDYVGITHNQGNNIKTVSVWFKLNSLPTGIPGGIVLANASSTSGPTGFDKLLRVTTSGKIEYYFHDGSGRNATGTTTLTTGVWYYAAGVTEGSRTVVYLNGKEEGSYASVSTNSSNYAIVDFDDTAYSSYAQDVNGVIDEVKLYNAALTSDEIALDYNRGQAMVLGTLSDTSGLTGGSIASSSASAEYCIPGDTATCSPPVARWDFEEKSGANAYDTSGSGYTGTITSGTWTQGKIGGALDFNGSSSKVSVGTLTGKYSSALTVEAWVNHSSTADWDDIVAGGCGDILFGFSSNQLNFGGQCNSPFTPIGYTTNINGAWHHVVGVYNGSYAYLYVDGQLVNSAAKSGSFTPSALYIGSSSSTEYYYGKIDGVRIYNYARSAAQIAWDYNRGGPVGHWRMDECQGSTAKDSSGFGNNGTITIGATGTQTAVGTCTTSGTAWYNGVTGKFNSSLNFDGTDDYVVITPMTTTQQNFTVSAWVKPQTTAGDLQEIVSKRSYYATATTDFPFALALSPDGTTYSTFVDSGNDYSADLSTSKAGYTANTWHHVTVSYDSSNLKLYVDGVLANSASGSVTLSNNTGRAYTIGRAASEQVGQAGKTGFNGQIDDVRIYNYALTATQVKNLFNGGAAVKFGPLTGSP